MAQRSWYRLETPDAPQGHALACDLNVNETAVAFEQVDGTWVCWKVYQDGSESGSVVLQSFEQVRAYVDGGRQTNPYDKEKHEKYVRAGVGALAGTVTGMLLGGLPGIVAGHTALAAVGSQVGGVLGAAGGAVISQKTRNPGIQDLKRKLLR